MSATPEAVSKLPSAARAKMVQLEGLNAAPAPVEPATPPVEPPTPAAPPPSDGERVTLSREELNELRAKAERTETALARAEAAAQRNEELQHRLTELEAAVKATPKAPDSPPASASLDLPTVEFTQEEESEYGDSREFIRKVARQEVGEILAKILPTLESKLQEIDSKATGAATTVKKHATNSFFNEVREKAPRMSECINHKNWGDFLESVEPMTGATYEDLLKLNVQNQRVEAVVNIYKLFESKYMEAGSPPSGYQGATPSAGAVSVPPDRQPIVKLKASERKKASEDYRKGKITWTQLQEVNAKFEEADKAGNVDYNA